MMQSILVPISARLAVSFRRVCLLTGVLLLPALALGQAFVQESDDGAASASSVNVTYTAAETAGNLNVVVVGWSDTISSVTSVVDDNNNTYRLAGTSAGLTQSQAIYYAANIAVLPNNPPTVTVNFNQAANFPDVRVLEYSGISATTPLDNWAGDSDRSVLADSGEVVTSANDLILAAGTTSTHFTAAGTGFTLRAITSPFGDIVEDSGSAQPAGTYHGTAPLTNGNWVMQVAGFSTTPVTFANAPTISGSTPIVPATGGNPGGTLVTITGTDFQPGAVVLFGTAPGGISGVNCFESGGTTITCLAPADSVGVKDITVVNVDGKLASSAAAYTYVLVVPPTISTITPASGPTNGSAVTITGTNFQVGATVTISGLPAGDVAVPDSATITANTPGLPVGPADVTVKNPDGGAVTRLGGFTYGLGTGPINYIQGSDAVGGAVATTIPVSMNSPQTAGNLNVVLIGWDDTTATVSSVTDTEGNTYLPALPTANGTGLSQAIYYAKNIAGDSSATPNVVTVTFSQNAQTPDVRILEYSGLDISSPLDAVSGNAGSGTLADSGACTTTTAVELIVAGATVGTHITGPGSGFTLVDLTHPNGNDAQHQITSVAGSCQATAPLSASSNWVMQTVSFKVPPPDFSVSATPASRTVVAGNAAAYTVSVAAVHGFNSAVALTCGSLPAGASCAFVPSSVTPGVAAATSALSITTSAGTPTGTSTVTITGTSGLLSHNTSVSLTVSPVPPPPDFSIAGSALSPASVAAGASATSTITVAALNGFNSAVNLSCSVAPVVTPAPACTFVPASIATGAGTSALTVSTSATTPIGAYVVTVVGSGPVNHSTTLNLTVTAAPVADYTSAATMLSPATISAGGSATSTITIAPLNGFNSTVNLSCAVTPVVSRPPTCALNPSSVANGSGTSVVTVKTTAPTTASVAGESRGIFFAMLLPIGGLAFLGRGPGGRRKKFLGLLLACFGLPILLSLAACGGGSSSGGNGGHPGTPAGTYTVTISATAGTLTHSTTVTVTVQ